MIEGFVLLIGILVFILTPICVSLGNSDTNDESLFALSMVWFIVWSFYFVFNYEFIFTIGLK